MRPLLASVFLLIFSFQIIPVKEIGKILYKGQITEEEVHVHSDAGKHIKGKKGCDLVYHPHTAGENISRIVCYANLLRTVLAMTERLPNEYVPEVSTPPPNC